MHAYLKTKHKLKKYTKYIEKKKKYTKKSQMLTQHVLLCAAAKNLPQK